MLNCFENCFAIAPFFLTLIEFTASFLTVLLHCFSVRFDQKFITKNCLKIVKGRLRTHLKKHTLQLKAELHNIMLRVDVLDQSQLLPDQI